MSMPIDELFNTDTLTLLSDFYVKFEQEHPSYTISGYWLNYRYQDSVKYYFSDSITNANSEYTFTTYYVCTFPVKDANNTYYTTNDFDWTTYLATCTLDNGSLSIPETYQTTTTWKRSASNLWQDNYLDIDTYKSIEIEPSPSPSPSPSPEPSTTEFGDINPYFWILPSFILMLIFMYRFLDKIFARGD